MKKKPILNAYETKLFNDWIEDGNAFKNDKGVWLEQTTQYSKKFTYDELQNFFKREYLAEGYNGGGRVKTKEYFQIYKLEDLRRKTELLLTDVELNKFIDTWNLDYNTDYADWIEFNEYEDGVKITPVFSKNEYGGNVNNSFVESEINSVSTWENEEIATYLEVPVNEVAKHRDYYVEETQNAMLVNQVDGDYADGGKIGKLKVLQKRVYESIKNKPSKSITTYNLPSDTRKILEELYYMDLLDRNYINGTQEAEYTLKYANGGDVPHEEQNFYTKFDEPTGFIFADGGKVLASSSSKDGINKLIEQYLYGSTIKLVQTDNDKIYEVHNKKGKTSFYVEFSRGKYKFIQPSKFNGGGGVGEFPPKGELTNKDNFLLKYEKKGSDYEFFVYKPITKEVSGYNQIKHVCLNKDCPQKMNYEQFINYLYAELYLDDTQYADGGGVGEPYDSMTKYQLEKNLQKLTDEWFEIRKSYSTENHPRQHEINKEKDKIITLLYGDNFSGVGQKFKFVDGGEVTYMQYNGVEIIYEPHFKMSNLLGKYYVNDEMFTSLEDAIKYIDKTDKMPNEITGNDNIKYIKVKTHNNPNGEIVTNYEGYWNGHIIDGFWVGNINELNRYIEDRILSINQYNKLKHLPIKELPKYADGGEVGELNIGQIFEVNRDSEKAQKYFDTSYGKGYVFIISDFFNKKVVEENQFWDAHIKLKVYDSNLKYIFPIRVFFKGKPYGLNLTKKLFSELLFDKSIFPSDNYYVEKESDYDRQEREFKGNGYVELIKRKINPIWKSIIDKFSEIYFSNETDNDYLVSDQVKARGSNPYSSYEFRNFSPLLSWADAEGKFKQSLTADELNSIEISYNTEEYADLEEHDTEKYHKQIVVKLKKYADGGNVPHADKMFQLPLEMVIYVPSTQDVDKVISVDKMDKRVDEVKIYLANKFGGYTSADKLGGFVDSTGNLVNEDVVQVTSFSTKEAYAENKEELINQLAKWGEEWGQESIGFEFEGDLMYVPQKFKQGGESKKIGFKGLANKVAKRYAGEKVEPQYQSEYGKKYSKSEAEEVGRKVAGKVYREQQSNKLANGGKLKEYNHLKEYYEKYVNGGFVGGDIIKFKYDGKEFTRKVESVDDMGNALVNLMKTQKATINPADIFDIKKDFSEKDVIIKKIGLNENLAEYLVSVSPTFAVWFADAIVENEIEERQESKEVVLKAINEKSISKNTNYFNNNFGGAIREILDWLQHPSTPKQNLRDLSFNEALEKSRQWHQELTTSGGDLNFVEPEENTVLITYPPNEFGKTYYWVFIPKNYCDIESSRMGHCGRTGAGSLISLRSFFTNINNESVTDSHVTIAYNKDDGLFYQAKGKQNRKPVEKYFPYIFNLIKLMASGKLEEEYKLKLEDKLNDLRSQEKKAQAGLEKIKKYFQSKEARTENAESIVEKANKLVSIREKLNEIAENIKMLDSESRFDFNGFGSEYQSSNDYGYEDFTTEQIKELYQLKPEMFKDFAGQYMLFQAGVVSEKPNTIFTLEKDVEYVSDLLRLERDLSDDFVKSVLSGEMDNFIDDSWSYYYVNAGDYVDDLNKEDYDKVLDKIVEITQLDKEIVKEKGAKHYLDGDDEEFSADNFEDIKRALANPLAGTEANSYQDYYYNQIKDALQELGTVKELTDEGVILEIDLANLMSIGEISTYMKDIDSDNLEDVFFESESNNGIELPSLSIDERFGASTYGWQEYFDINDYAEGGAVYPDLSMQKAQVVNDSIRIPEFELKQAKEVVVIEGVTNKKILNSDDAIEIFRNIWGKDTIKAYEQCYVLYLNKVNKVIGYYHHSAGGIDGTVMDIEMISGMAVKSLSKGVMIAHNHPSGNTTPSDADKNITKQLYQALKLFNITLLDSIILTEDSYLSFANIGLL